MKIVIHTNPHLANQTESAEWLKAGFHKHGINAEITADRSRRADVNVIQGPWWAYQELRNEPNTLFLNRAFYGHYRFDLSIGWLMPDGSRDFKNWDKTEGKNAPELKPKKEYRGTCVLFGDFGEDMTDEWQLARKLHQRVYFRPHPADHKNRTPVMTIGGELDHIWRMCDAAVGKSSTVLVQAEIEGLHVTATDPLHVVKHDGDRQKWINRLSWAQWNHEEIKRGAFWEHLNG